MLPNLRQATRAALFLCLVAATATRAQQPAAQPNPNPDQPTTVAAQDAMPGTPAPQLTLFPHPDSARYLLAGQANIIFQAHPGFHSPYSGLNSFLARGEYKTSLVGTLITGFQLNPHPRFDTDLIFDLESAGGRGLSEALGLAGFTNLDVVRNPNLGPVPYVARVQLHQTLGLTSRLADSQRTPFSLATKVPARRFDLRAGKMSLPDVLDLSGPGSDSHLQFLNWTVDNDGAWDYAADTRGYTYALVAEYDDQPGNPPDGRRPAHPAWAFRYALALMPSIANGTALQWNLRRARGENFELEYRRTPLNFLPERLLPAKLHGVVRLLGYVNHADMGDYRQQNEEALAARAGNSTTPADPSATPVITDHPPQVTTKYGFGLNFEQELPADLRLFGRFGWNDGAHESFVYTEVDQTFELGADLSGARWGRPNDKAGVAGVTNAIKRDHQTYLALGGLGFLLGDGALDYAREDILETYYTAHNWRGLYSAFDLQLIAHPGYNQARGPIAVFSVRTHVDF